VHEAAAAATGGSDGRRRRPSRIDGRRRRRRSHADRGGIRVDLRQHDGGHAAAVEFAIKSSSSKLFLLYN
jgi:hypothetical protein